MLRVILTEFRWSTKFRKKKKSIGSKEYVNTLKENRIDTQMKFCEVVARPTLFYGSETWVTTKRDISKNNTILWQRNMGDHETRH